MFELETVLKQYSRDADPDSEVPLTLAEARDIVRKFVAIRQTLRRIVSMDPKNAAKYAQSMAAEALSLSHA
jgi:hypothetical protein